jgi:hypothetical protein
MRFTQYLLQPAILRDPKVRALLREIYHEVEERDSQDKTSTAKGTLDE